MRTEGTVTIVGAGVIVGRVIVGRSLRVIVINDMQHRGVVIVAAVTQRLVFGPIGEGRLDGGIKTSLGEIDAHAAGDSPGDHAQDEGQDQGENGEHRGCS